MSKRILIVDDDAQICASLRKMLQAEGHEVRTAAHGEKSMEELGQNWMDLLLLDPNASGGNGRDILERLTAMNLHVPVIVITGRRNDEALAFRNGVVALFEKPLDVPLLLRTVGEVLAEPRRSASVRCTQPRQIASRHSEERHLLSSRAAAWPAAQQPRS